MEADWVLIRREFETGKHTAKELAEKHGVTYENIRVRKSREKWGKSPLIVTDPKTKTVTISGKKPTMSKPLIAESKKVEKYLPSSVKKSKNKTITTDDLDEELTEKEKAFCVFYLYNFNAGLAAFKAGFGNNIETAYVYGCKLLRKDKVSAELDRLKAEMYHDLKLSSMDVMLAYMKMAFGDIKDVFEIERKEEIVFDDKGNIVYKEVDGVKVPVTKTVEKVMIRDGSQIDGQLISELGKSKDGIKVKMQDRKWALEKLEKYLDMLPDKWQRMIEEEKLNIEREKLKISKIQAGSIDQPVEDDGFIDALKGAAGNVWGEK